MRELLSWAERFVATPSVSGGGSAAIAEVAAELLEKSGLEVRLQPEPGSEPPQMNVIGERGPAGGRDLLLVTHLDTVPPGDPALWTATGGDPFRPTRDGDRLYGLGSADAKVDLVCKARALSRLDLGRLTRRIRVVGTFGEEVGLRGSRHLIAEGGAEGFALALVGEPSELTAIRAHKGYAVFEARIGLEAGPCPADARLLECDVDGASSHSSTPDLGRNAIEGAFDRIGRHDVVGLVDIEGGQVVNRVPDHCSLSIAVRDGGARAAPVRTFDASPLLAFAVAWRELLHELSSRRDAHFDPDHTVGSLGAIRLDGACAVLTFDLRPVPGVEAEAAIEPLRRVADLRVVRSNPPLAARPDAASELLPAVRSGQRTSGVGERVGTKATCTEAGLYAALGMEAIVLGPGRSVGNVHSPNEHTSVSQLESAVAIYRAVIERLCLEKTACTS